MIIQIKNNHTKKELELLTSFINDCGAVSEYDYSKATITVKNSMRIDLSLIKNFDIVEKVIRLKTDYPLVSSNNENVVVQIKNSFISRNHFTVISGPCSIKNYDDLYLTASGLKKLGINFLRGGAFKLRTSPYSFQGLGKEAIYIMKKVCDELEMISVSEITSVEDLEVMAEHIDILMIGMRNMQNYPLLSQIGKSSKPVILKRGMSNTIDEWLMAAEYIAKEGNNQIILCERGIRSFENFTRNTLDLSAVPAIKELSCLPIIVDPSHSTGRNEMVKPMAWAAVAAGADGLIIEASSDPKISLTDARQTINLEQMQQILEPLDKLCSLWDKTL